MHIFIKNCGKFDTTFGNKKWYFETHEKFQIFHFEIAEVIACRLEFIQPNLLDKKKGGRGGIVELLVRTYVEVADQFCCKIQIYWYHFRPRLECNG